MGKRIPNMLCFVSVFLCFLLRSTTTDQIVCTMCETCENPCQPPVPVSPPPPPPNPHCPPPPPPPPLMPKCPPPPAPSSSGIYYFSPPPPPPAGYSAPTFTYLSPPPPPMSGDEYGGGKGGGRGSACVGYCIPSPPISFVPYFPNNDYDRPPLIISKAQPSSTTLKIINPVMTSLLILLSLVRYDHACGISNAQATRCSIWIIYPRLGKKQRLSG